MTSIRALHEAADAARKHHQHLLFTNRGRPLDEVMADPEIEVAREQRLVTGRALDVAIVASRETCRMWLSEPSKLSYDAYVAGALACHATDTEATSG